MKSHTIKLDLVSWKEAIIECLSRRGNVFKKGFVERDEYDRVDNRETSTDT